MYNARFSIRTRSRMTSLEGNAETHHPRRIKSMLPTVNGRLTFGACNGYALVAPGEVGCVLNRINDPHNPPIFALAAVEVKLCLRLLGASFWDFARGRGRVGIWHGGCPTISCRGQKLT